MGNVLDKSKDELLLEYINYAISNLLAASEELKYLGVNEKFEGFNLIKDTIAGDYDYCLKNSVVLNPQEIITVETWFKNIAKIIRYVGNESLDNPAFRELQNKVNAVLTDKKLCDIRKKLTDAVNSKKEETL